MPKTKEPAWRMVGTETLHKDDARTELFAKVEIDPNPASLSSSDIKRCLKEYGVEDQKSDADALLAQLLALEVFLPLVGIWEHRKFGRSYKIQLSNNGKLLWQGQHIDGEPLSGVLQPEGNWICSELSTPKEAKVGSVRLRHGPDWNQLSLNFKTSSVTKWGADVFATRASDELRICRPPFLEQPKLLLHPEPKAQLQPTGAPVQATSVTAAAELSCLSLAQLKECLKEYGVSEFGRCCNHKDSLAELLLKVESAVPLVGRWQYGKPPNRKSYQIRRLTSGFLKWEGPHSRGGMLSGILDEEEDGWLVAQLTTNQNETIGSIRLRHGPKCNEIMSNFRSHTMTEWGSNIIAERVGEEEPLRRPDFEESESEEENNVLTDISELSVQEVKLCLKEYGVTKFNDLERREQLVELLEKVEDSLPLLGTWQHGRHTKQYEIQHTEDGQLLWEGPHIFGGTLVGVLYEDAETEWLRAELFTCKEESEQVGSVKISHGPDWHEMTLKFMPSNSDQWGDDIVAKRSSKEQTPRRPKPLPAIRDLDDDDELIESQYWESLEVLSQALRVEHAALPPLERRAKSWARSVAFAQMTLGMRGIPMKGGEGAEGGTFVIWVLGATTEVEVSLAEQGYFKDMNWLDRTPTRVYIIGENLLEDSVEEGFKAKTLKETVSASVTKEDAATYVVVYSRVFVRDHPSMDGKYVGDLFEGTEVHGREEGGWLRLDQASAELCVRIRQRNSGPTWVLIDGRQLGLGRLLEKKTALEPDSPSPQGAQSALPTVRTACYDDLPGLLKTDPPDLGVILMPNFTKTATEDPQQGVIPSGVLEMLDCLPVVVSSRCRLHSLNSLGDGVLLPQMRCPFSAGAGDPSLKYDDNGWIFGTRAKALATAALVCPEPALPAGKVKIMFWGIVDLKYDHHKPLLERIRVLETGDGRISRFSGDGAPIQKHFEDHYQLQEQEAALQTYNFISKDKKLTHDLFDATGYAHIIPRQVCFPRVYYPGIASHISAELGLREEDDELVVLKLCNRSRAAGVLIVPLKDLEDVLQEILEPPKDLQNWFQPQLEKLTKTSARNFNVIRDSHEEHVRHWWANESPSFVAERCCSSMATTRDGRCYDGTMRVTFALRRRMGASEALTPEDIEVDWLGGYWKLPNADMSSSLLRERIISQAKTGTAPVQPYILMEVYGALSSALQQLFGAAEFTSERLREQYKSQPELAAYLIARRAMSLRPEQRMQSLCDVEKSIVKFTASPAKSCVESFVHRAHGVLIARGSGSERWKDAHEHFRRAVEAHPSNSNALFQLGLCALELGPLEDAVELMNKSLLLDSDFRAPYVNLGVAYLRQASHSEDPHKAQDLYLRALEISEACLMRHPASPQCNYHIGVACTQLAFYLQDREGVDCKDRRFVELRSRAAREFLEARGSVEAGRRLNDWQEAQARGVTKKQQAPWLSVDDKMLQAVEVHMMQGQTLKPIKIPEFIGWRLFFWRV